MARQFPVALALLAPALLGLAGCNRHGGGALKVAFIDNSADLFARGSRLSPGAQHLRAATASGLVSLDQKGEVVPALADRWIVTDDGMTFILRLRDGAAPDGHELSAQSVRAELVAALHELRGTSLGLELAPIAEVRAMAGRVIEIRLASPVPALLQLLAQPELVLSRAAGTGPMVLTRRGNVAVLTMKRPAERGLPEERDWSRHVRPVELIPASEAAAVELFGRGDVDVVLGGGLDALPLAPAGPLSRGTIQLDPAIGLFGLQVRRAAGFLADPRNREALAMALDRPALVAPFNIAGWTPTTRIVAPQMPDDPGVVGERWAGQSPDALRAEAGRRVAAWRGANHGTAVRLTLAMGTGPGDDVLFHLLAAQLATIGVVLDRVPPEAPADLGLVDKVARYAGQRWFLDQFSCALRQGLCDTAADALLAQAMAERAPAARARAMAEAELRLTQAGVFVPFGSPLRFSLVRSSVNGFAPNAWGFHPLPPLAAIPK